ncbi:MAG: LysR family transcriptional regulator [Eubacteriales bacterium]|nr:LysR family transcriptional regulator [Eubacteriales bacterium]
MFQGMEYIYEVYKERSFSRAARNLYISQPSLSATVKRIETRVGSPIFDRSTTPIGLTECGKKYIECVESILAIQNSFQNYLGDLGGLKTGHLSLGGTHLFSSYVLPPLIGRFTKAYPQVTVDLIEENSANLELLLMNGSLDLVVDNSRFNETLFSHRLYQPEHLLLAVPSSFAINQSLQAYRLPGDHIRRGIHLEDGIPSVPLEAFRDEPFVFLKPENDTRHREMALCRKAGFSPRIILELDQQVTAYNITGSGMGISFISDTLARHIPPHPHVTYYKLDGPESCREIHFYWKTGKYVSKAMEIFLETSMPRTPGTAT